MEYQSVIGDSSNVNMFGYYKNQFEMSHLPMLTRFFGDESCFHFGQVRIEGAVYVYALIVDTPQLDNDFFAFTTPPFTDAHQVIWL